MTEHTYLCIRSCIWRDERHVQTDLLWYLRERGYAIPPLYPSALMYIDIQLTGVMLTFHPHLPQQLGSTMPTPLLTYTRVFDRNICFKGDEITWCDLRSDWAGVRTFLTDWSTHTPRYGTRIRSECACPTHNMNLVIRVLETKGKQCHGTT